MVAFTFMLTTDYAWYRRPKVLPISSDRSVIHVKFTTWVFLKLNVIYLPGFTAGFGGGYRHR